MLEERGHCWRREAIQGLLLAHRRAATGEAREHVRPLRRPRQNLGLNLGRVFRQNLDRVLRQDLRLGRTSLARAGMGTLHVVARAVTSRVVPSARECPQLA